MALIVDLVWGTLLDLLDWLVGLLPEFGTGNGLTSYMNVGDLVWQLIGWVNAYVDLGYFLAWLGCWLAMESSFAFVGLFVWLYEHTPGKAS